MSIIRNLFQRVYYLQFYVKSPTLGKNIKLSRGGTFMHSEEITMGNNIFISENFHISAYQLKLHNNIIIGPNLVIECSNHKYDVVGKNMFEIANDKIYKGVEIEDDVWIGANVTILPGVIISEGCIVGAGSVVTKSLPPYSISVGIPCKPIKSRFSKHDLHIHLLKTKAGRYSEQYILKAWKNNQIDNR